MNPFKNLIVNLQAGGVAAVAGIWIISLALITIFAPDSKTTANVLTTLQVFGGILGAALLADRR